MRFSKDYIKLDKDWWSDDQGDICAGQTRDGVYYDKYKAVRKKLDDCKKNTPDGAFKNKDIVRVLFDTNSLGIGYPIPKGDYVFDSYDSYDNTCFIVCRGLCMNVCLDQIKKVVILKNLQNEQ